jgi:hypothetical protein
MQTGIFVLSLLLSHAPPETTVTARPNQAIHANAGETTAATFEPLPACRNAASAMKTIKKTTPETVIVAAKCAIRT